MSLRYVRVTLPKRYWIDDETPLEWRFRMPAASDAAAVAVMRIAPGIPARCEIAASLRMI